MLSVDPARDGEFGALFPPPLFCACAGDEVGVDGPLNDANRLLIWGVKKTDGRKEQKEGPSWVTRSVTFCHARFASDYIIGRLRTRRRSLTLYFLTCRILWLADDWMPQRRDWGRTGALHGLLAYVCR